MNEYILSTDKFQRPKIIKDKDAIYLLLIRLLLRVPGSSQTHPEMGVGLVERFRYIDMEDINELQNEITKQVSKYLPNLRPVSVEVEQIADKHIRIKVKVDNTLYVFISDFQTIRLSDI